MEFHFNIEKTIGKVVGDGIVFLDGAASKDYSQKDFENILALIDINKDKYIDYEEFKKMMIRIIE